MIIIYFQKNDKNHKKNQNRKSDIMYQNFV